ncbi:MAG: nuclear transport factor 2 family protein [Ilumatobacteraceae bacterium]
MAIDVQYLLDLEGIKRLRYRFARALDTASPDALADLFTDDGWIDVGPFGRMEGRERIRRGYKRAYEGGPEWHTMHCVSNPQILVEGDTATGNWQLIELSMRSPDQPVSIIAVYDDEYRRVDGEWKLAGVTLSFKWSAHMGIVDDDHPMTIPPRPAHTAVPS